LNFLSFISDRILDIFPSTPFAFLIYLGAITFFSILIIFYFSKKRSKSVKKEEKKENKITIEALLKIANNPKSTSQDLLSALMLYNENFKVENDVKKSLEFFKKVLTHKNRKKAFFDYFHGNILPNNLKFKNELDKIEKEALNIRDKLNSIS